VPHGGSSHGYPCLYVRIRDDVCGVDATRFCSGGYGLTGTCYDLRGTCYDPAGTCYVLRETCYDVRGTCYDPGETCYGPRGPGDSEVHDVKPMPHGGSPHGYPYLYVRSRDDVCGAFICGVVATRFCPGGSDPRETCYGLRETCYDPRETCYDLRGPQCCCHRMAHTSSRPAGVWSPTSRRITCGEALTQIDAKRSDQVCLFLCLFAPWPSGWPDSASSWRCKSH